MSKRMSKRTRKRVRALISLAAIVGGVLAVALLAAPNYITPTQREEISRPVYTVGDANYTEALEDGRNVVKFGKLPLGLYRGGMAFETVEEAESYLSKIGKQQQGWGVFELSGDFELDTYSVGDKYHTNKPLLVTRRVNGVERF